MFFHQNPIHASLFPHSRYMPRPSHSSRFSFDVRVTKVKRGSYCAVLLRCDGG
jgi:hypothetical protein